MTPLRHDAMYSPWGMVMWDSQDVGWPSATNLTHQKILVMYDVSPKKYALYLFISNISMVHCHEKNRTLLVTRWCPIVECVNITLITLITLGIMVDKSK